MGRTINIGVLGTANIAKRSLIPTLLAMTKQFNVLGVASRSLRNAELVGEKFKIEPFEGYENLIYQPGLDAVYIPLPNALHSIWIEASLNRNLHVLVEKSLACDLETVKRLNDLAQRKNLVLIENFQFRFHSQLRTLLEYVHDGSIGELRCIRSSFGFPGLPNPQDIRYQKDLGGGALLDTGAYPLKIAQILMGKDIEVKAANLNILPGKEVDIWGGAYVQQQAGGLFGELAFGFNHQYQCTVEIWGSKGRLFTDRIFTAHPTHKPTFILETTAGSETISLPADNHFKNMLNHFHTLVVGDDESGMLAEYRQNENQARLIEEVRSKSNE
jgi:dTDP-3,4-didehydro-2,6-dideoxy-alpha-D-glucose 3-reductase